MKKTDEELLIYLKDEPALIGQYVAVGKHIGAGWVEFNGAHPVILKAIRHRMVLLDAVKDYPEGTKVSFAFERNKNCLKMIGWHIA